MAIPAYRRDPNRVAQKPRGSAKLVLIKVRAENARRKLGPLGVGADEFALKQVSDLLLSIIDICEAEEL